jgi:MFS family permease
MGEVRSWQVVFLAVGAPGVLLGLLVYTFAEPRRLTCKTAQPGDGTERWGLLAFLMTRRRFIFCHHAGFTVANIAVTGMVVWGPAYLARSFGWTPGAIGVWLGLVSLAGGLIGAVLQGRIVDRWFARGVLDAQMRWYAFCAIAALPIGVAGMLLHTPAAFLTMLFLLYVLVSPTMGIAASSLAHVTPAPLRGRASAFYLFVNILFGIGAGPSVVAAFTDFVFRDDRKLGLSLACTFGGAFPLCALLLFMGLKASRQAVAANQHKA